MLQCLKKKRSIPCIIRCGLHLEELTAFPNSNGMSGLISKPIWVLQPNFPQSDPIKKVQHFQSFYGCFKIQFPKAIS